MQSNDQNESEFWIFDIGTIFCDDSLHLVETNVRLRYTVDNPSVTRLKFNQAYDDKRSFFCAFLLAVVDQCDKQQKLRHRSANKIECFAFEWKQKKKYGKLTAYLPGCEIMVSLERRYLKARGQCRQAGVGTATKSAQK